ncbi:Mu-like prophage major head subunit gpT family protein [Helicobacter cynogastricus]|uniref:Mu-like prophage major head subunit gpT family protein n=1 Tax=Helicobacter cynogastricus TaxID=329937 RepID=UPI000CF1C6D5|nr:Mu-like prophage major head subunit gpT family protein [Helicobacter cynogastricus]
MKLTPETQAAISKSLSAVFAKNLANKEKTYQKVALEVSANTMTIDYRWLASLPSMREWVGERQLKELEGYSYTITKKNWESTIKVDRDLITYDSLGIVGAQVASMADLIIDHYNSLIFGLFNNNGNCYDGQAFFHKQHAVGQAQYSNLEDWDLDEDNLLNARKNMMSLTNESGQPLNIMPNLLLIHPSLEASAMRLLKAATNANGASNICYGLMDYLVCPYLNNANRWILLDTTKTIKPLILQKNKPVEFNALDKSDSAQNFLRRELLYGIDSEDNAGYGLWQLAFCGKWE